MISIKHILLAAASALFSLPLAAQVSFTGSYSQNFDSMGTAGTAPPTGWKHLSFNMTTSNTTWTNATGIPANGTNSVASIAVGTASTTLAVTTTPSSANNNGYNAAASAGNTSDRVIATSPTSTTGAGIQLTMTNGTSANITTLTVAFDTVRYAAVSTANELPGYWLFVSTDGTSWTNVTPNPTITTVPNTAGTTSSSLTVSGLSIAPAGTFYLRWLDDNAAQTSPDQAIGLNNVVITAPTPNTPPAVALTAPITGATYEAPASITLTADASDSDGTVSKVEYFNGTTKLGEATTSPYSYTWNNVLISGSYTLTAKATDNSGATTTSSAVNITVTNTDNVSPSVAITSPAAGGIPVGNITINATASDTDGIVSKVEFFNGATKLGEATASLYSYTWNNVAVGSYTLTAKATDNDGGTTISSSVAVNVVPVPISVTENFDSMGTAGTALPAGWSFYTLSGGHDTFAFAPPAPSTFMPNATPTAINDGTGSGSALTANPTLIVATDPTTQKSAQGYNVGLSSSPSDRALGSCPSGNAACEIQYSMSNTSGQPVTAINIGYDIRRFTTTTNNNTTYDSGPYMGIEELPGYWLFYSLDDGATWTNVAVLNPTLNGPTGIVVPNTVGVTTVPVTQVTLSSPWAASSTLLLRWFDDNAESPSPDQMIGLDNVSISAQTGTPPTVALTAPADNASFAAPASVNITADAADADGTVTKVEFFNGASKLGEATAGPYGYAWTGVSAGSYTLTAKATDNDGNVTVSDPIHIVVNSLATIPPTVAITAPADNASFTALASITISADAADSDGSVTKVEFFNGAAKLGEAAASPYGYAWTGVSAGSYTLTAKATDNDGNVAVSDPIHIVVNPPTNNPPTVAITAPADNASFSAPATITIAANAADSDGTVSKVEFFNGATKLGEAASAPYSYSWSGVAVGDYTLTAKATDNLGASTTSAAVVVHVLANQTPSQPWSFGVIADTQQTQGVNTTNNSCAINIISAVNKQFVARNVDLVLAVGDLGDDGSVASLQTRLAANAGTISGITGLGSIPFYALRGNHEDNSAGQTYFQNNFIPASSTGVTVSLAPDNTSYAVNYKGTTFVLLDIQATEGITSVTDQETAWMNTVMGSDGHQQAFVLQHKDLLGQNHKDSAFGSSNDANPTQQNNFFKVLSDNGVRYDISGHDHMNHRSIVTSPDGLSKVQEIICQSDSTKFYTASSGFSTREQSVSDQQNKIGYYIFTVDGPKVTGEYWATDPVNSDIPANPVWTLQDTFGYSTNGKQTTVARGSSYAGITDTTAKAVANGETGYQGTAMRILAGTNSTTGTAEGNRAEVDDVNTGWAPKSGSLVSDVLTLWGMNNALGSTQTDTFTLSLSYSPAASNPQLVTRSGSAWVNAVSGNTGGTNNYAGDRPFNAATDTLGTYGYDSATHTTWAVINHNSDFAVTSDTAPTVTLTAPADGASYIIPDAMTITANAADSDGTVAKVEFFDGATKLGEAASAPYIYNWSNPAVGSHALTAVATDNLGVTTTSTAVNITVTLPTVTITATRGSTLDYGTNRTLVFTVTRDGPTTNALVVPLIAGGSATQGTDYSGFTNSVTIPAGSASTTLTLTALSDNVVDGTETVTMSLGTGGFTAGASSSASGTIADAPVSGQPWSFGVMADTQLTGYASGGTNGVSTDIIDAVNTQFIARGVDFVIQVGDLCEDGGASELQTRLDHTKALTDAGIRFFGLRGNHEGDAASKTFFQSNFVPGGSNVEVAPFDGASYAVTWKGCKFVVLDYPTSGSTTEMDNATAWTNTVLGEIDHSQAFMFHHKNLLGQNHKDNQFGSGNDSNTPQQNAFLAALQNYGVRYDMSGHDHMNHRSIVTSPDGLSKVQEIICQSDSTKFYTASSGFSSREQTISDQQGKIGYYTYTVDGPKVTGRYYTADKDTAGAGTNGTIVANPVWTLQDTFGYSLNGTQTTVARGGSYVGISDDTSKAVANGETGYQGTAMSILAGTNSTTGTAEGNRPEVDDVNTGWAPKSGTLVSDVLSLWGMNNALGSAQTDTFTLSLSYDPATTNPLLVSRDGGAWMNAVSGNVGGTSKCVGDRPFNAATDTLGTYGFDSTTHTAWAVINHNSDFAVASAPTNIQIGSNTYVQYSTGLAANTKVWLNFDGNPDNTPIRATQRFLGYREVNYKGLVSEKLALNSVTPTTAGGVTSFDYSAQSNKSNYIVGFWADKNLPIIIGPDGKAYITDGHHTTAGYLAANVTSRYIIPGYEHVVIGTIVANYYDAAASSHPTPDDTWWLARESENNTLLYGIDGNQLTRSTDAGYAGLQPVLPSVQPMPLIPGKAGMADEALRSVAWGMADGIVKSATNSGGTRLAGYSKASTVHSGDTNFVEFYWCDFLRNRITWDDTKTGSALGTSNADRNLIQAPLGFYAAVANGTALAKSEVYRDQYGRTLADYNSDLSAPNTRNWAIDSTSAGRLAAATDTYNMYLLDDSTVQGDITPSLLSQANNMLHIDTTTGQTIPGLIANFGKSVDINQGSSIATQWKDAVLNNTTYNSTLTISPGTGRVTFTGANTYTGMTNIGAGTLALGATGSIDSSAGVTVAGGATFDTTAKSTYAMPAGQTFTISIDGAGSGSSGHIIASGLDISNASVSFNIVNPLDDKVYVIGSYTGLTGTAFASVSAPSGYALNYAYNGNQIALVSSYSGWAAANASGQAADQDAGNTGVPNGVKYFMGASGSTFTANPGVVDGAITWPKSPQFLGTYVVEVSSDLATWEPATTNYASYIADNGTSVVFTLPAVPGQIFTRLRVTPAP